MSWAVGNYQRSNVFGCAEGVYLTQRTLRRRKGRMRGYLCRIRSGKILVWIYLGILGFGKMLGVDRRLT
jgi:hypothetical protein